MHGADMEAIVGGYHGDPFAHLGPHGAEEGKPVIRAFLPHAASAAVVTPEWTLPMRRIHESGLFEAAMGALPERYQLRVELSDGSERIEEDPYRFWPQLSDFDVHLHGEGTNYEAWRSMGAHLVSVDGVGGVRFAVWAPSAEAVCAVGDFNEWDNRRHPMRRRDGGIWELFIPGVKKGDIYKYFIRSQVYGASALKCDPYGFYSECPPKQGSVVWELGRYDWGDDRWLSGRAQTNWLERPVSAYEVHLESWKKSEDGDPLSYRELGATLIPYVKELGFTHLELMPPMEHPYAGSWGYQVVGYFAPTARFGTPDDFKYFIDQCHQNEIGVIIDWVPAHFPKDAHGLARFDGTACYEHEDPRQGEHKDWGTLIFNFGRNEVKNFLVSNAMFWLKEYHIDGLRVDAVASIVYLDYSRNAEDWIPNRYGGNFNLEAIDFLRTFNEEAHKVPGVFTAAEESTSFAGVSHPTYAGGLGFTMKWNMGWMHDMFAYFKNDPLFRKFNHHHITFSLLYAFTENFILPISHDEVVHGKSSLIGKMPGDEWQRFANVRAFLGYMWGHPGKKLLFMGCELGQYEEWDWQGSLHWELLKYPFHNSLKDFVQALNRLYIESPALHEIDFNQRGFEWIDIHDIDASVISFLRRARNGEMMVFVCNFTPAVRRPYNVGMPAPGAWHEVLNSDWSEFGGSGVSNPGTVWAQAGNCQGRGQFVTLSLPPLGVCVFKQGEANRG